MNTRVIATIISLILSSVGAYLIYDFGGIWLLAGIFTFAWGNNMQLTGVHHR